jgi:ribosome-associated protein
MPTCACGPAIIWGVADFAIRGEMIRLSQLIKAAGLADSGAEAKELVAGGAVTVNAECETRRGRQLRRGDVVAVGEEEVRIV